MKKIVGGFKDENGIYISAPQPRMAEPPPISIPEPGSLDEIGDVIILALSRAVKRLTERVVAGDVSREVIGALKDCEGMFRELSKKEREWLKGLTDEQLSQLANEPFKPTLT